jgi:CubicO group peptidase (beta-lactamase class C family)
MSDNSITTAPLSELELFKFRQKIEERMKFYQIPGLSLGIFTNKHILVSHGFGFRDLEDRTLVTPKTFFALGSMTKSLTAL